jgi:hypothetical protein
MEGIDKLTLHDMMKSPEDYRGLSDSLIQLPVSLTIRLGRKYYAVPQTLDEFCKSICFGQRLFLSRKEENDFGVIIRVIDGYYYPIVTVNKWDDDKALLFGKIVLPCKAKLIYPIAMHLTTLVSQLAEREQKLLHREPTKIELAAGIERLNPFSELTSLNFLRDTMKVTIPEVLLTPYNECLVHFMLAKEQSDFQERYYELMKEEANAKNPVK